MRRGLALGAVIVGFVATIAGGSDYSGRPALLFSEEFSGSSLAVERWRTCHWWSARGCTIATNDELEWYAPGQVRVSAGAAHLVAQRGRDPRGDGRHRFLSGMISTGPGREGPARFAFRYGRAAIRARLPAGDGMWPAFWLLPADRRSEPEIDVFEVTSDAPRTVSTHLHHRRDGKERSLGAEWSGLEPGWHTFAVDWRPDVLEWFVDGRRIRRLAGPLVPQTPMYLIANLAVSGDPPPTRATPSPAELTIDWIRVTR